jgi:hypothetical protein
MVLARHGATWRLSATAANVNTSPRIRRLRRSPAFVIPESATK